MQWEALCLNMIGTFSVLKVVLFALPMFQFLAPLALVCIKNLIAQKMIKFL